MRHQGKLCSLNQETDYILQGFSQVFCEADWPDMERVHRYVRGLKGDRSAVEALAGFQRFPNWMWKNQVMVDFVEWAKKYNECVWEYG